MKRLILLLALAACAGATSAATLKVDGEIFARRTAALMPPSVEQIWMFNITQLAPDGAPVKKGDVVMAFDAGEVMKQLVQKQGTLKEKQSQLDKLVLDLAERERNERVTTAEARASENKAQTKTAQPAELIGGIAYKKLLVERHKSERRMALTLQRERLAAEQRAQERRMLAADVAQLQADVRDLQASIGAMNVAAPRSGVMMHKSSWRGDKFDVGSQVWRGQAVAEIPDASTLAVSAQLPERDLRRVKLGTPARIVIEGGAGSTLRGKVSVIGRAVRSKSRLQPVPILDLEIELADHNARLRPGQAVRVELTVADVEAAAGDAGAVRAGAAR